MITLHIVVNVLYMKASIKCHKHCSVCDVMAKAEKLAKFTVWKNVPETIIIFRDTHILL